MLVPTCAIKFVELVLTVTCMVLHHYSYDLTDIPTLMLCSGTYVGYLIVLSGEIVGEMSEPLDLVQDMAFCAGGVALFSSCGALQLAATARATDGHYLVPVNAGLAFFTAAIMLFDLAFAYLDKEELEEEASI